MSDSIRLSKVLKELNISIQRAVEFLQTKNIEIEARPTTKISEEVFKIMVSEFQSDRSQRAASTEVVLQKIPEREQNIVAKNKPEEKSTVEEDVTPVVEIIPIKNEPVEIIVKDELVTDNVIRAKAKDISELKTIGKIDLDSFSPKKKKESIKVSEKLPIEQISLGFEDEVVSSVTPKPIFKEVETIKETQPIADRPTVIEPILESKEKEIETIIETPIEIITPQTDKVLEVVKGEEIKVTINSTVETIVDTSTIDTKPIIKAEIIKIEPATEVITDIASGEITETIRTNYQKLDGPKITGQTIDLSQFKKPQKKKEEVKVDANKANIKRKRIAPTVAKPGATPTPNASGHIPHKAGAPTQNRGLGGGNVAGGYKKNFTPRTNTPAVAPTEQDVQKQIKDTLEKLTNKGNKSKSSKYRKDKRDFHRGKEDKLQSDLDGDKSIKVTEFVTVSELATLMNISVTDIISTCMSLGLMVTMNQRLDSETISIVSEEFGFEAVFEDAEIVESEQEDEDAEEDLITRPPIVTVMGHVDHGKTSLLDYIRSANVIAGESGGITQHIGAYNVEIATGQHIAFLDTPGHEAFTAMRARGAKVTDIVIIVIAADDDIMPQTKEAISHAQAANVPMIFAINKIDKPNANAEKIKEQLAQLNLLVEDWGGKIQSQEIAAKGGLNVDKLLEKIVLEAELLELKSNPNKLSSGTVIEAALDKGRGYVSTIMVQNGTLKIGDYILAGKNHGKVKAMLDERGHNIKEAGPSTPVTILGLDGAPTAGDKFRVFTDEREAKQLASKRGQLQREQNVRTQKHLTLDEIGRRIAIGEFQELNIILKGDVDGSVEALTDSLQKLSTPEIHINILHRGVGAITESDVLLASASSAIVIGFNVRPSNSARDIAQRDEVEIRNYSIIYDAINDVKEAMLGMLAPVFKEQIVGNVEIRETFKISKLGTIAGCMVLDGKIMRNSNIRIIREGVVVHTGELASLKRYKDDAKEVLKSYECGLNIKGYNDIQIGDIIEAYEQVEVAAKLA